METETLSNPEQIALIIGAVVTIANAITAMFPTRAKNPVLSGILRVLNILAINIGKNRNADDV